MPNSGTLVLPMMMAPLFLIRSTKMASSPGTVSSRAEPQVERRPRVGARSFTACGKPCIQPRRWPRASSRSRSSACSSRSGRGWRETMALILGLKRSMWSRKAAITSRQETRFAAMASDKLTASIRIRSETELGRAGTGCAMTIFLRGLFLLRLLRRFGSGLGRRLLFHRRPEAADTFSQALAQVADLLRTEQQQGNPQDQQDFRKAKFTHNGTPKGRTMLTEMRRAAGIASFGEPLRLAKVPRLGAGDQWFSRK